MADLSEYSTTQQKVIKEVITNDKGFHSAYMIADAPFYGMVGEADNGQQVIKKNIECSLSTGNTNYDLNIYYSVEEECWFYKLSYLADEVHGIIHYNTVNNAKGLIAFVVLNDNVNDTDITASLPYSNVLVMGK